jgi:hypothetical protein
VRRPGLPDGLFSNQKSKFGQILEGLALEDVGIHIFGHFLRSFVILYEHLVSFVVIWYIFPFWYFVPRKIWQSWRRLSVESTIEKHKFTCIGIYLHEAWILSRATELVSHGQNWSLSKCVVRPNFVSYNQILCRTTEFCVVRPNFVSYDQILFHMTKFCAVQHKICIMCKQTLRLPLRRGIEVIQAPSRTEDPRFDPARV